MKIENQSLHVLLDYWISVAQFDARPISYREVTGSTPAGLATFFCRDLSFFFFFFFFFFTVILSLPLIQEGKFITKTCLFKYIENFSSKN